MGQEKDNISDDKYGAMLSWLEKQKEQIPYIDFVIKPHKGDDNNPYDMRISEAQEYAIKRGFGIPFNDGEVYVDERHLTQTIGNILRWADEHPKEQKPELVQQPTITYTYNSNASRDERLKAALLALLNSDLLKIKEGGYFTKQDLIDWVERIPTDRPAWSEEDEKILNELITIMDGGKVTSGTYLSEYVAWLKSIRPQPKRDCKDCAMFLNGKCTKPHWKPSDVQMDALKENIDFSPETYKLRCTLVSLYNDLKKLKED